MTPTIIDIINQIDNVQRDSQIAVCEALLMSYDKADMIIESYDGNFEEFPIVMESANKNDEPFWQKILLFIPRLISQIFDGIRKSISKENKADTRILDKLPESYKNKKKPDINKIVMGAAGVGIFVSAVGLLTEGLDDFKRGMNYWINRGKDFAHKMDDANNISTQDYSFYYRIYDNHPNNLEKVYANSGDRHPVVVISTNDRGELKIHTFDIQEWIKDTMKCFNKLIELCDDNKTPELFTSINKFKYENYIDDTITKVIKLSGISYVSGSTREIGEYSPSHFYELIDTYIKKLTDKSFERKLEQAIKSLLKRLHDYGTHATTTTLKGKREDVKSIEDAPNGSLKSVNVTSSYSMNKIQKHLVDMTNFVMKVLNDTVASLQWLKDQAEKCYAKLIGQLYLDTESTKKELDMPEDVATQRLIKATIKDNTNLNINDQDQIRKKISDQEN